MTSLRDLSRSETAFEQIWLTPPAWTGSMSVMAMSCHAHASHCLLPDAIFDRGNATASSGRGGAILILIGWRALKRRYLFEAEGRALIPSRPRQHQKPRMRRSKLL
ncbi:hypothetical protein VFPPC_15116 [Pochonia chlamydosporia 170]|uniref:Uncharacterized protein n=1 Tax=Pochonia chlamydosporia 170 TaxID=1380566 RepID=A0A179G4D5_METCM|nr:hypothetical protein VFPPC_15116 [Pochonia chlamydosporia 170]OAQ72380.1 hypothetical protein VFPPC_15116 [Pochonia chlamydosporia 170]